MHPANVFGGLLLVFGVMLVFYFLLIFDTSVAVPSTSFMGHTYGGGRVHNVGLMQDRQNGIIVGGMMSLAGLLLVLFGASRGGGDRGA